MSLFLPETRNPASTVQTSGNYTVPAGFFAYASALATENSPVTINGTTVLQAQSERTIRTSVVQSGSGVSNFTFSDDAVVTIVYRAVNVGDLVALVINGTQLEISTTGAANQFEVYRFGAGDGIRCQAGPGGSATCYISGHYTGKETSSNNFWLRAGDSISGGNKHIAVYAIPPST